MSRNKLLDFWKFGNFTTFYGQNGQIFQKNGPIFKIGKKIENQTAIFLGIIILHTVFQLSLNFLAHFVKKL